MASVGTKVITVHSKPHHAIMDDWLNERRNTTTELVNIHHQNSLRVALPENTVNLLKNSSVASPHRAA
jgi:hypothetical protein